jgi:Tol biopolymer transport system component
MRRAWRACTAIFSLAVAAGVAAACVGDAGNTSPSSSDAGSSDGAPAQDATTADGGAPIDSGADTGSVVTTEGGTDAGVDAARCNPTADFGPGIPMSELNVLWGDSESARLSPDELTIYFSSDRDGGAGDFDIWTAGRATLDGGFGTPSNLQGVNTSGLERFPSVTANGLFLYESTRPANYTIGVGTRGNTVTTFGGFGTVAQVSGTANDINPYVLPDHSALYFGSDRSGSYDIFRAARVGGSYQTPVAVPGALINTTANEEQDPVVTQDELTLYFASGRGDVGSLDIYVATRKSTAAAWGAPQVLLSISTPDVDTPTWISPDNCVLYFTRNVAHDGGPVHYDLYYAVRGF